MIRERSLVFYVLFYFFKDLKIGEKKVLKGTSASCHLAVWYLLQGLSDSLYRVVFRAWKPPSSRKCLQPAC